MSPRGIGLASLLHRTGSLQTGCLHTKPDTALLRETTPQLIHRPLLACSTTLSPHINVQMTVNQNPSLRGLGSPAAKTQGQYTLLWPLKAQGMQTTAFVYHPTSLKVVTYCLVAEQQIDIVIDWIATVDGPLAPTCRRQTCNTNCGEGEFSCTLSRLKYIGLHTHTHSNTR